MKKEIYTTEQLAERWNIAVSTLERWRCMGTGPNYIKLGENTGRVLYRTEDIEKFEERNTIKPENKNATT